VLVSIVFVIMLPVLLISTSLRILVTDRDLLLQGFADNRVAVTTGLDQPQLERIADAFVSYFQSPPGQLQMEVTVGGQRRPLFNDREVQHMEDVQALIQVFLRLQIVAVAVLAIRVLTAVTLDRSFASMGREMLIGAALIIGLVILVGILSLADFSELWTRFHQVAFRNDMWLLDPRTDYLIMLFPEPFWFAATIRMATLVGLGTIALVVAGLALMLFGRRD